MRCYLCGRELVAHGHNAWPLSDDPQNRCCSACNYTIVVPARFKLSKENTNGQTKEKLNQNKS